MERSPDNRVTREELYELVWSEPMVAAAKRFGVSGSYLARVCFGLSVPRPPRGLNRSGILRGTLV